MYLPVEATVHLNDFPNEAEAREILRSHGFELTDLSSGKVRVKGSFLKLKPAKESLDRLLHNSQTKTDITPVTKVSSGAISKVRASESSGSRDRPPLASPSSPTSRSSNKRPTPPEYGASFTTRPDQSGSLRPGRESFIFDVDVFRYAHRLRKEDIEGILGSHNVRMELCEVGDSVDITLLGKNARTAVGELQSLLSGLSASLRTQEVPLKDMGRDGQALLERIQKDRNIHNSVLVCPMNDTLHLIGPSGPSHELKQRLLGTSVNQSGPTRGTLDDQSGRKRRTLDDQPVRKWGTWDDQSGRKRRTLNDQPGRKWGTLDDQSGRTGRTVDDHSGHTWRTVDDHSGRTGRTVDDHSGHTWRTVDDHSGRTGRTVDDHSGHTWRTVDDHSGRTGRTVDDHSGHTGRTVDDHSGRTGRTVDDHSGRTGRTVDDQSGRTGRTLDRNSRSRSHSLPPRSRKNTEKDSGAIANPSPVRAEGYSPSKYRGREADETEWVATSCFGGSFRGRRRHPQYHERSRAEGVHVQEVENYHERSRAERVDVQEVENYHERSRAERVHVQEVENYHPPPGRFRKFFTQFFNINRRNIKKKFQFGRRKK